MRPVVDAVLQDVSYGGHGGPLESPHSPGGHGGPRVAPDSPGRLQRGGSFESQPSQASERRGLRRGGSNVSRLSSGSARSRVSGGSLSSESTAVVGEVLPNTLPPRPGRGRSSGSLGSDQSKKSSRTSAPMPAGRGFFTYLLVVLPSTMLWAATTILTFSSIGVGQEVLDWLQKYDWIFYPLTGTYMIGLSILYLLDFYFPPHLPGQYLRFRDGDKCLGRILVGVFVGCFVGSCFFMCNAFPSVPLLACVLATPVVVGIIRKLAEPKQVEPAYEDYAPDEEGEYDESYLGMSTEDVRKLNAKYVRNVMWMADDAGSWWQAVFVSFLFTGAVTIAGWIFWAITIGQDLSDINDASLSVNEKEELWILWSTPGIFGACNFVFALFAGFRVKLQKVYITASGAMLGGLDPTESAAFAQNAAIKHLVTLVKIIGCMFVLTIGLLYVGVQLLYTDSKIAAMVMGLMGALFVLFAVCTYLSFRSVVETMGANLKQLPMWKTARSVVRSDWARATFIIIMMFPLPPLLVLSLITQRVRKCRNIYGRYPDLVTRATNFGYKDPRLLWLTPRVNYALKQMAKWERIPIIFRLYLLCGIAFSYMVVPLLLNVSLAWVQNVLAEVNFGIVIALTFLIGLIAFLLPPVPGMTIYIFGGLMLASTCPIGGRGSDIGFWAGAFINVGLGWFLKLVACAIQQGLIGGLLGRNLWVRQTVGVHTVAVRSIENVLRKKGLSIGKVAILCGGPDWPTSVLAGMLKLSLLECELGTMPIIFFVGPCSLSGSFYLKKGVSQLWERAANMMILLSVVVNVSLWAVAAWAIQGQIAKDLPNLSRPLVSNVDLEWLDFKAVMVKQSLALTWDDVPRFVGWVYMLGAFLQVAVVTMIQFGYYWFFQPFEVSDDISTIKGWDDLITFRGVVAVSTYFFCWICYFVYSQWQVGHTWRQELLMQKKLGKAEAVWKAEWIRLVKAWIDVTPDGGTDEAMVQKKAIAKAAYEKATRPPDKRKLELEEEEDLEEDRRGEEHEEAHNLFMSAQVGARAPATLTFQGLTSFGSLCAVGVLSIALRGSISDALEEWDIHDFGPLFFILMGAIWLVLADFTRKLLKYWDQGGDRFKKAKVNQKSRRKQRWPSEFLRGVKERSFQDFASAQETRWRPPPPGSTFRLSPFGAQDWRNNQLCGVLAPQLFTEQVVKSHVLATAIGLFAGLLAWWVRLVPKFTHHLAGWSDIMFDNLASTAQTRTVALTLISIALTVFIVSRVRSTFRAVNLTWQMQGHAQDLAQLVGALLAPLRNDEKAPEVAEALWTVYRYLMAVQYLTYEAVSSRLQLAGGQDALYVAGLLTELECQKLKPRNTEEKFKPGRLGLDMDWINGTILGVRENGLGDRLGIREGWQILKIDDRDYKQAYFRRRLIGHKNYKMTFAHEVADARALEVMKWLSFAVQRMVSTQLIPQAFGAALLRPVEDLAKTSLEMCTTWGTAPPKLLIPLVQILALAVMLLTPLAVLQSFDSENDAASHYVFAVLGSSAISLVLRCVVTVGEELSRPFNDGINALNPDWLLMRSDRQIFTTLTTGHVPPIKKLEPYEGPKNVEIAEAIDLADIPQEDYYGEEDVNQEEGTQSKSKDLSVPSVTPSVIKSEWDIPSEAALSEAEIPEDMMSAIRSWSGRSSMADTGGSVASTVFGARVNTQLVEACYAGLEYPKPVSFDASSMRHLEVTFGKQLRRLCPPESKAAAAPHSPLEEPSPRSPRSPGSPLSPGASPKDGLSRRSERIFPTPTPRAIQAIDAAIARVSRAADAAAGPVPPSGAQGPGAVQQSIAKAPRRQSIDGAADDGPGRHLVVLELLATLHQELRDASDVRLQAVVERRFAPPVGHVAGPHAPSPSHQAGAQAHLKPKKKHRRLEVIPEGRSSNAGSVYSGTDGDDTASMAASSIASEGIRRGHASGILDLDDGVSSVATDDDDADSIGDGMIRSRALPHKRRDSDVLSIRTESLASGEATPPIELDFGEEAMKSNTPAMARIVGRSAPDGAAAAAGAEQPPTASIHRGITDFWNMMVGTQREAEVPATTSQQGQTAFQRFATSFFWPSERVDENSFVPVRDAFTFNDPRNKGKTVHIIAFSQPGQDEACDRVCHAGYLSNHWKQGQDLIHLNGKAFKNAEAAFQALKFWEHVDEFADLTAEEALQARKKYAGTEDRTYNGHGGNWAGMMAILRSKFQAGSKYAEGLLQTGDAFLLCHISVIGRDQVWSNNHRGDGTNWLGMQLMLLRDELRNAAQDKAVPGGWTRFILAECRVDRNTGQSGSPTGRLVWQECVLDATQAVSKALGEPKNAPGADSASGPATDAPACARPGCGKPAFQGREGEYCSKACRDLAASLNALGEPVCLRPGCGRPTYNGEPNQYCSRACREQDVPRLTGKSTGSPTRKEQKSTPQSATRTAAKHADAPKQAGGVASPGGSRRGSTGAGMVACARAGCGKWLRGGQPGDYCSRLCRSLDTGKSNEK
mmetsp:Transcript_18393/g.42951  ORF Transcript_18393/g.42951 Transcript_18393/m.42951 type:complete len:2482 (+) Transcript_18393:55-7500(+)